MEIGNDYLAAYIATLEVLGDRLSDHVANMPFCDAIIDLISLPDGAR